MAEQPQGAMWSVNQQQIAALFELAMRAPMSEAERLWVVGMYQAWQASVQAAQQAQAQKQQGFGVDVSEPGKTPV